MELRRPLIDVYDVNEFDSIIEQAIDVLRKNEVHEPYRLRVSSRTYELIEQSPFSKKQGRWLYYYSKVDGLKVFVEKPKIDKWQFYDFGDSIVKKILDTLKDMKDRPFEGGGYVPYFDPMYFKWEGPVEIRKPFPDSAKELIEKRKNREIYIPKKVERKRWNEPFNKKRH